MRPPAYRIFVYVILILSNAYALHWTDNNRHVLRKDKGNIQVVVSPSRVERQQLIRWTRHEAANYV